MTSITKKKAAGKDTANDMDLRELLVMKIKMLHGIESDFLKTLGIMAKKANDADLRSFFEERADQTESRAKRLQKICDLLGIKMQKMPSEAMHGLIADAEWTMKNVKGVAALDAALVSAACAIEYHMIAGYETAIVWTKLLEEDEVADILEQTLEEENDANEELGDLAELKINEKALLEDFGEDGEEKGK